LNDFQTPNQIQRRRRLLLTFALTFVVIFITQQFIKVLQAFDSASKARSRPRRARRIKRHLSIGGVGGDCTKRPRRKRLVPHRLPNKQVAKTETVIENDLYQIKFSNKGGVAKSWVLKKYKDDKGNPLEALANSTAAQRYGYPLSLYLL